MRAKLFDKVKLVDGRMGFIVEVYDADNYEFEEVPFNKDNWLTTIDSKQVERLLNTEGERHG